MSQRNSGYRRKMLDDYATPAWVTQALLPHLPSQVRTIWEPAAGRGQMVHTLKQAGFTVFASDISPRSQRTRDKNPLRSASQ
jgi:hypothetical protein